MTEVTIPSKPVPVTHDPALKILSYRMMGQFWQNGIASRFEIYDNIVRFEFPMPNMDSPYHVAVDVPHQKILQESNVVWGELYTTMQREMNKIKSISSNPGSVAGHLRMGP